MVVFHNFSKQQASQENPQPCEKHIASYLNVQTVVSLQSGIRSAERERDKVLNSFWMTGP